MNIMANTYNANFTLQKFDEAVGKSLGLAHDSTNGYIKLKSTVKSKVNLKNITTPGNYTVDYYTDVELSTIAPALPLNISVVRDGEAYFQLATIGTDKYIRAFKSSTVSGIFEFSSWIKVRSPNSVEFAPNPPSFLDENVLWMNTKNPEKPILEIMRDDQFVEIKPSDALSKDIFDPENIGDKMIPNPDDPEGEPIHANANIYHTIDLLVDFDAAAFKTTFEEHIADKVIHITQEDLARWYSTKTSVETSAEIQKLDNSFRNFVDTEIKTISDRDKKLDAELAEASKTLTSHVNEVDIHTNLADKSKWDTAATVFHTHILDGRVTLPAYKIMSPINPDTIPDVNLNNTYNIETEEDMYKLTSDQVDNGTIIYVKESRILYVVIDNTKLDSLDGYRYYNAPSNPIEYSDLVDKPESTVKGYGITDLFTKEEFDEYYKNILEAYSEKISGISDRMTYDTTNLYNTLITVGPTVEDRSIEKMNTKFVYDGKSTIICMDYKYEFTSAKTDSVVNRVIWVSKDLGKSWVKVSIPNHYYPVDLIYTGTEFALHIRSHKDMLNKIAISYILTSADGLVWSIPSEKNKLSEILFGANIAGYSLEFYNGYYYIQGKNLADDTVHIYRLKKDETSGTFVLDMPENATWDCVSVFEEFKIVHTLGYDLLVGYNTSAKSNIMVLDLVSNVITDTSLTTSDTMKVIGIWPTKDTKNTLWAITVDTDKCYFEKLTHTGEIDTEFTKVEADTNLSMLYQPSNDFRTNLNNGDIITISGINKNGVLKLFDIDFSALTIIENTSVNTEEIFIDMPCTIISGVNTNQNHLVIFASTATANNKYLMVADRKYRDIAKDDTTIVATEVIFKPHKAIYDLDKNILDATTYVDADGNMKYCTTHKNIKTVMETSDFYTFNPSPIFSNVILGDTEYPAFIKHLTVPTTTGTADFFFMCTYDTVTTTAHKFYIIDRTGVFKLLGNYPEYVIDVEYFKDQYVVMLNNGKLYSLNKERTTISKLTLEIPYTSKIVLNGFIRTLSASNNTLYISGGKNNSKVYLTNDLTTITDISTLVDVHLLAPIENRTLVGLYSANYNRITGSVSILVIMQDKDNKQYLGSYTSDDNDFWYYHEIYGPIDTITSFSATAGRDILLYEVTYESATYLYISQDNGETWELFGIYNIINPHYEEGIVFRHNGYVLLGIPTANNIVDTIISGTKYLEEKLKDTRIMYDTRPMMTITRRAVPNHTMEDNFYKQKLLSNENASVSYIATIKTGANTVIGDTIRFYNHDKVAYYTLKSDFSVGETPVTVIDMTSLLLNNDANTLNAVCYCENGANDQLMYGKSYTLNKVRSIGSATVKGTTDMASSFIKKIPVSDGQEAVIAVKVGKDASTIASKVTYASFANDDFDTVLTYPLLDNIQIMDVAYINSILYLCGLNTANNMGGIWTRDSLIAADSPINILFNNYTEIPCALYGDKSKAILFGAYSKSDNTGRIRVTTDNFVNYKELFVTASKPLKIKKVGTHYVFLTETEVYVSRTLDNDFVKVLELTDGTKFVDFAYSALADKIFILTNNSAFFYGTYTYDEFKMLGEVMNAVSLIERAKYINFVTK